MCEIGREQWVVIQREDVQRRHPEEISRRRESSSFPKDCCFEPSYIVPRPTKIIALLTDFGIADHYVGTMKGVILSINPSVHVVDISHEVEPQRIAQGAFLLWSSYRYFPRGTIFVCVVDPGVGTTRRILALRTKEFTFVAPDNGLLDFIQSEEKILDAVEVRARHPFALERCSSTFHGRDIFAPVAAHLSLGTKLEVLGPTVSLPKVSSPFVTFTDKHKHARVLSIDRFGNIATNIRMEGRREAKGCGIKVGKRTIRRWTENYATAPSRTPCLIVGSSGVVEIVVRNGSTAKILRVDVDSPLRIIDA